MGSSPANLPQTSSARPIRFIAYPSLGKISDGDAHGDEEKSGVENFEAALSFTHDADKRLEFPSTSSVGPSLDPSVDKGIGFLEADGREKTQLTRPSRAQGVVMTLAETLRQEGLEQGLEKGIKTGQQRLLLRLSKAQLNIEVPPSIASRLAAANDDQQELSGRAGSRGQINPRLAASFGDDVVSSRGGVYHRPGGRTLPVGDKPRSY